MRRICIHSGQDIFVQGNKSKHTEIGGIQRIMVQSENKCKGCRRVFISSWILFFLNYYSLIQMRPKSLLSTKTNVPANMSL